MPKQNYRDLTKEQLVELLEARDRKKFGLVWERDAIEADRALNEDFVVLDAVTELHAGAGPFENLIIEGDNFDGLRALRAAYAGKVKCLCIDPPYNTGNRDFVYNDRFVDKDHAWRHSLWLEFMHRRLTLAKDLLAPDGAIFVCIDDNEIFHLGMLMHEVFGEANFLANVIWQKVFSAKNTARHFSADHDFILAWAADGNTWLPNLLARSDAATERYKNPDKDRRGVWTSGDLQARNPYSEGIYPITCPSGRLIPGPGKGMYWRFSKKRFDELDADRRIWWGKDGNGMPRLKRFLSEVKDGQVPQTIWNHSEVGHTQEAKKELLATVHFKTPQEVFSTPKPVRLIERILQIATKPGDLVVDFFAGSGTTAHAVLKMNAANPEQPPRKFILISNTEATAEEPGKNLCRDVCRQRVANVIAGYGETPGTGGNFAYLRTQRIPMNRVVRRIDHPQVWLQLQLMHFASWSEAEPVAAGRLFVRAGESTVVAYLTALSEAVLKRVEKELEGRAEATLYTWQPEAVAAHFDVPGVTVLPIPQTLIDRFGLKK
jgi:adenine-specific DNA-methyltransferase